MSRMITNHKNYEKGGKYEFIRVFTLRLDKELYARIIGEAAINNRSVNSQIITMLEYQVNLVDKQLAKFNNK